MANDYSAGLSDAMPAPSAKRARCGDCMNSEALRRGTAGIDEIEPTDLRHAEIDKQA